MPPAVLLDWVYTTYVSGMDRKDREEFDYQLDDVLNRKEREAEAKEARRQIARLNER